MPWKGECGHDPAVLIEDIPGHGILVCHALDGRPRAVDVPVGGHHHAEQAEDGEGVPKYFCNII